MGDIATASGDGSRGITTAKKRLIGFILVLAVANVAYRLVDSTGVAHTAALYVGVPTILAIGLALLPRTKSATGGLVKGATLAVLIAGVVLPEGALCLLFALPLVLLIALVVGGSVDLARHYDRRHGPTLMVISLPLLLFSMEGVAGSPFDTADRATASLTVGASPAAVAAAMASPPGFANELPRFLTIGFNRPLRSTGAGIAVGDRRVIEFNGGTHDDHPLRLFGLTGSRSVEHHSQMQLSVIESSPGRVTFGVDEDTTMLARWAHLQRAVVTWQQTDEGRTRVTWRLEYERLLYPTAYFAPLQRFGLRQAADYLLESVVVAQLA